MSASLYEVLGVERTATPDEIKAAFRALAYLHPDKNPKDKGAARRFAEVSAAYAVLSDPAARAKYDLNPTATDGPAHVTEAVDLVVEIVKGAQGIDPARAGLRLADAMASTEGRAKVRNIWAGLRGLFG
jgi:DnaJ-class molecular chaperone